MKKLLYIFLIISLFGCHNDIPSHNVIITRCKDIPVGRAHAMAWSANGQGYILGGRDSVGVLHNDLWAYDPQSDTWKKIEDSPLTARVNGTACAVGEKIYLGLGFHQRPYQSSAYLQDWWEYTPLTNEWRRLQDFPNKNTVGAVSYTQDNKIYCVHGSGVGFTADVIAYDIANNQWEIINRPHRNDRMGMAVYPIVQGLGAVGARSWGILLKWCFSYCMQFREKVQGERGCCNIRLLKGKLSCIGKMWVIK